MRYQLIVAFDDCACKSENTNNLQQALGAVQIYLDMPTTIIIHIFDRQREEMIFDWCRD